MAASQQPPPQQPPQGAPPAAAPPGRAPGPAPPPGPPSSAAAHAADLERQIRRRSWVAALAIAIALAAAGVALYVAIDTRDNSATKDELEELRPPEKEAGGKAFARQAELVAVQHREVVRLRLSRALARSGPQLSRLLQAEGQELERS